MLSNSQINQYKNDGYVIPDFKMPEEVLLKIEKRHTDLLKKHPEFKNYCSAILSYDEGFLDFCKNEKILDYISQLIGPDFALWNSSFFAKPPIDGHATPWHQDGQYWPIRPLATCTVWLAIDNSTPDNGCLKFIKGSHIDQKLKSHNINNNKNLTLNQELSNKEFDETKAINLVLERGQISLHDVYLVHGSEANNSPNSRRAMTMRFMPTSSIFDHQLVKDKNLFSKLNVNKYSERKIYHMRGKDISGKNKLTYV
ncbi:phytanoyl-CoA dioxygenase family protein [Alphaproteobacteria bacterium]|nr:phytanoyl-CoA dioxygenase family protein [Alphaproteobacteria bacterium]